jgi:hypothetical protein
MSDFIFEKGDNTMDLNDDEQAILDEIEIDRRPLKSQRKRHPGEEDEDGTNVDIPNAFMNPEKRSGGRPPPMREEETLDHGEEEEVYEPRAPEGGYFEAEEQPSPGFKTIDDEKADILNKLQRFSQKKGLRVNARLTMYSAIDELRSEIKRIRYSVEVDQSVKFSRRMMVAMITGMEFMNKRYDPFDLKLEGWSESMMENVEDYDEVFEELFIKYRSSVSVPPEIKLMMMVGGSGMMFHLSNSMFKSLVPNVNDVMKQNPDLMANMMSAVQSTMGAPAAGRTPPSINPGGRREMQGPGVDLGAMMGQLGGFTVPPPPVNTYRGDVDAGPAPDYNDAEDISDIVSVISDGDTRDLQIKAAPKRRGRKKKTDKTEINI